MDTVKRTQRRLTGIQKSAILLIALGSDLSSKVLKQNFRDEEIERLSYAITTMERIPSAIRDSVLEEFKHLRQAREYLVSGGVDYCEEVLQKTVGKQRAAEILKKLTYRVKSIPFSAIRKTDPKHLATFISSERSQTVALVLSYLEPEQAATVLATMEPERQVEIARRIAIMERTSPEVVHEVESVLEQKLSNIINQEHTTAGGIPTLVEILNYAGRATEKNILTELEQVDRDLTEEIRSRLFIFEDIVKLDDISIQRILREVNAKDLALAMRGSNDEVKDTIYRNLSKRASQMLKDEIDFMGPVRLSRVEEAQTGIIKVIRNLEETGEIVVFRGGDDAVLL